jgi:putative DNA primase/helicase
MTATTSPIDTVLECLDEYKPYQDGYRARCPSHKGESSTSLSIKEGDDGRVLLYCHAECDIEEIVNALGLQKRDLFPERNDPTLNRSGRSGRQTQTPYPIRDVDGTLLAYHVRIDEPGGKKFRWKQVEGMWGLNGRKTADMPLYRVHDLNHDAGAIVVCEGEKAAEALYSVGIQNAVGTVTGANGTPADGSLEPLLNFQTVYLWPDADSPGTQHMQRIGARLQALGHTDVRMIEWLDASVKADAADYVAAGNDKRAVSRLAAKAKPLEALDAEPRPTLNFLSAREVAEQTPAKPEWTAEGFVALGVVTEITGKIKHGKTTLTHEFCRAILTGQDILGKPTQRSPIIYLTEQAGTSFREALRRSGLIERDDLTILFRHDATMLEWPEIIEEVAQEAIRRNAGVLVVDTLSPWAGLRGDAENDSGAALEAMEPLQNAAAVYNLAVVVLRHDRKSGGDVGDSARGSSAFGGAVDIMVSLRRGEGNTRETVRVLNCLSRFDETPESLTIEWTPSGYVALGSLAQVAHEEARQAIINALPTSEPDAVTEQELRADLEDVKRTTAQQVLRELVDEGTCQRIGEGKRGDPFRYFLSAGIKREVLAERNANMHADPTQKLSAGTTSLPAERNEESKSLLLESSEGSEQKLSAGTTPLIAAERNETPDKPRCRTCGSEISTLNKSGMCSTPWCREDPERNQIGAAQ